MLEANQNTGFIAVDPVPGDFIAGGETAILETPINAGANWTPSVPTFEDQLAKTTAPTVDTNACVTFAAVQSCETRGDYQITNGLWDAESIQWLRDNGYFDANGKLSFSKRFTANMSGTDPAVGNTMPAVWASIRHDGLVATADYPMPVAEIEALGPNASPSEVWAVYYRKPLQAVIDKGIVFAARFPALYEWTTTPATPSSPAQLSAYLQVAPLQIATAVCPPWNTSALIQACGPGTAHSTLLLNVAPAEYDILDHYNPFIKHFAINYNITYGMRGILVPATQAPTPPATFQYTFTKQLTFGDPSNDATELHALQKALQHLESAPGVPYMKVGVFGPFGPQTESALGRFQTDHGVPDAPQGHDFGPKTRVVMNALLNK